MLARHAPIAPWIALFALLPFWLADGGLWKGPQLESSAVLAVLTSLWSLTLDGPHVVASALRLSAWEDSKGKRSAYLWALAAVGGCTAILLYSGLDSFLRIFFVLSYAHIAFQHRGFFRLIQRLQKGEDLPLPSLLHFYFVALLWAPLLLRLLWGQETGGLPLPVLNWTADPAVILKVGGIGLLLLYVAANVEALKLLKRKVILPAHLLYVAALTPIHVLALFAPWPAIFCVMLLTLSHNLQYLDFTLGWRLHLRRPGFSSRWHAAVFFAAAILFTAVFIRGALFDWWTAQVSSTAGAIGLLISVFHYGLDSRMWKVRGDPKLASYLHSGAAKT